MRILILGLGISGSAALEVLLEQGHDIVITDKNTKNNLKIVPEEKINVNEFDVVVSSPGIRWTHPLYAAAIANQIPITGEMEIGLSLLPKNQKVIGITGSNGKTTTTSLITHILNVAGKKALALGNIGKPLCAHLKDIQGDEILVCELSSFQLETMKTKIFDVIAITNITENHLDAYSSFEDYKQAKLHLLTLGKEDSIAFISSEIKDDCNHSHVTVVDNNCTSFATGICNHLGIKDNDIKQALATFKKPPHRMEFIAEISGITFINDSKSTTVHSTIYAVQQLKKPIILLAGGKWKGFSFSLWKTALFPYIKKIIAFGESATKIRDDVYCHIDVDITDNLQGALHLAIDKARVGDCILLSPGCSSYDQFKHFEDRGDCFVRLVQDLKKE
ncbi:MAG: hypothetical protein HY860_01075 [Chlamydiales bacterium]|nr:hypothetical protein [Chlamydiales bacterium]